MAIFYLEALLVVLVLFQESGVVDDNLGVGDTQIEDLVIYCLCRFYCTEGLLEIDVK